MKVGNDLNITAVNAEKNVELGKGDKNSVLDLTEDFYITAVEPVKMVRDCVVLTKRGILALLQFTKQILHTSVYFSLKTIFLSKAETSLQSVATFCKQVELGQHVYVHNCGGLQKTTFQESRQVPPAVGVAEMLLLTLKCCRLFSCSAQIYLAPRMRQFFQEKGFLAELWACPSGTW